MATVNYSNINVRGGNEGMLDDNAAGGPGMVSNSLTLLFTTRGTLDLNLNRLPIQNDVTVRPTDPLIVNDSFVMSSAGTAPAGVTGTTALNPGDLLVLIAPDATVAANWQGILNSALPLPKASQSSAYNGQVTNNVRVVGTRLPFFP